MSDRIFYISGGVIERGTAQPVPHVTVQAYDSDMLDAGSVGEAITHEDGRFGIPLDAVTWQDLLAKLQRNDAQMQFEVRHGSQVMRRVRSHATWDEDRQTLEVAIDVPGSPSTIRSNGQRSTDYNPNDLIDLVSDIAAYMPTAGDTSGPIVRSRPSSNGGSSPSMLGEIIDRELMAVLGGRVKTNADAEPDAKSFVASLVRAFPVEEVDGQTIYKHVPRAYAVHTELGGQISGAQASLYRRAKAALDDALPLLDGLTPLAPGADAERVDAVRSIVRTEFIELVNEFGREGGPRVQRVDLLFGQLPRHIADLEAELGFNPSRIVTVDDERIATNFRVIKDYITGLQAPWDDNRKAFAGGDTQFLGTQLVLLSRAFNSVAESVDEVYRIMDSVYLGASERQTVRIPLPDENGQPQSILVEDLLNWVARFATEEGPTLAQQGGRPGVLSIRPIAERLQGIVETAANVDAADVNHVAFSRDRVRRALRELAAQIGQVKQLVMTATQTAAS